jgi:TRAP-type C4-dicarboxylate transport system permease large subunit
MDWVTIVYAGHLIFWLLHRLDRNLFLTVPLFLPIVLGMGFDNVWFGVVFCMNMHTDTSVRPRPPPSHEKRFPM